MWTEGLSLRFFVASALTSGTMKSWRYLSFYQRKNVKHMFLFSFGCSEQSMRLKCLFQKKNRALTHEYIIAGENCYSIGLNGDGTGSFYYNWAYGYFKAASAYHQLSDSRTENLLILRANSDICSNFVLWNTTSCNL